ncbi:MAG: PAS domain S-box protein [Candidatus Methanoperedens sp.]|uniref:PAS domain-containing protein n=1 Tax=Candidatus Methanoperedens sp. BLZ2 TaxID=2035255 RepID=UPI001596DC24|nr:PAS domain S-box protein [Candidatus Methanoperedens sp. BLZ2]MBZ0176694.1 PAS domain S-box protein [Candidatus Methanoperedens nitroreducens]MCX9080417.1 PAS domain S-box protein [Candidatus Methanoperedens sp.]
MKDEEKNKAEVMFQGIFDFAPDAIIIVDREGRILQANSQAEKIFGYAGKELIGRLVEILIPQRFRKRHDEHLKGYIEKPRIRLMGSEFNLYGLRKDGTEFPVDIALGYLETEGGIIVLSIVRDITEYKRMEEAIRISEAKYRGIFENAAECIFQTTIDGRILVANPACVRILGYTSTEELIASVTDVRKLYAELGRRLHLVRLIRADGAVSDFEAMINRKDGSKIWVSINAHALEDAAGMVLGLEGMVIDITNRKRAEKNFQNLIEGAPDAIIAIDRDFNILLINTRTEKLFGYTRLELIGNPYNILLPERFREKHAVYCKTYYANPSTKIMALHMNSVAKRMDNSEFPVEINMSPVETDGGIIIVIDIRDISEKKK